MSRPMSLREFNTYLQDASRRFLVDWEKSGLETSGTFTEWWRRFHLYVREERPKTLPGVRCNPASTKRR